jgi:hypothetical protein
MHSEISQLAKLIMFEAEHNFQIQTLHCSKEYKGRIIGNIKINKNAMR